MFSISFVTLLLIAINYYGKETLSAPMPDHDNDLIDDTLIKFESSNDPV